MKKRLSHFPYNERSRPAWTPQYLPPKTSEPNPIHHENCYLCPRYVCYPCSRSIHPFSKGEDFREGVNPSLAKRGRGDLCVQSDAELCAEFLRHRSSESKRDGNR